MIKAVTCFKRRPDLSLEEFRTYWQTAHAEKVLRLPGLRRYVQNPTHDSAYASGREPVVDGVAETWFDDMDAVRANAGTPEYCDVRADEENFIDTEGVCVLLCDEVVIKDGPVRSAEDGGLKYLAFVNRQPGMDVADFQRYWREVHGPIAAGNPYLRRYVQCHVRPGAYTRAEPPRWDGIPMTWFDSWEDLRASADTQELAATRADEKNFLAGGRLPFAVVTERRVLA